MNQTRLFSNRDLSKLIFPLIIEQILSVTVGMADVIMVSSAGDAAISGVSLVDMINVLIINIFAALATGGAVVASQLLGSREPEKACKSANQLLSVTFLISVVIMGLLLLLQRPLLQLLFGAIAPDVMDNCITYLMITAFSYPFVAVYNSCAALFRSMGNSKISMFTSFIMNVINIGGNAILIYGFRMGIAGVAWPSLVSRVVAAVVMLILIRNPLNSIHIKLRGCFKLDFSMIRRILHIGVPNGLENSMFQLGRVLVVSIISGFGTAQITANAVANNLDAFGVIPGQAIGLAMITVIGHCVGAGDFEQVRYYTKKLIKITYIILAALNAVILLLLPTILGFYQMSSEAYQLTTTLVWIHDGLCIFFWPLAFVLPNALRAANDVRFTMVSSVLSMWFFRIVFSYILGVWCNLGAIGVWIAMVFDWWCRIACFLWRYLSGKWKAKALLK